MSSNTIRKKKHFSCTNLAQEVAVEGRAVLVGLKGDLDAAESRGAAAAAVAFVEAVVGRPTAA